MYLSLGSGLRSSNGFRPFNMFTLRGVPNKLATLYNGNLVTLRAHPKLNRVFNARKNKSYTVEKSKVDTNI